MSTHPSLRVGPLAATLGRLDVGVGDGGLDLSARIDRPGGPGWILAPDLAADRDFLEGALERIERGCGVKDRAYAGTSLLRIYLWRILTTSVAAFLLERRLPDLRAENVSLRFGDSGFAEGLAFSSPYFFALPDDPEAGHPDAVVLPSEEYLLRRMREPLAESHLPPLISALRSLRVRRGTRVLWGAGVDVCAEAFMFVGQSLGCEVEALGFAEKLLAETPPLSGPTNFLILERDGQPKATRMRNTCCLYYRLGSGPCSTCPRITNRERRERQAAP